jgi:hypothetical protein
MDDVAIGMGMNINYYINLFKGFFEIKLVRCLENVWPQINTNAHGLLMSGEWPLVPLLALG